MNDLRNGVERIIMGFSERKDTILNWTELNSLLHVKGQENCWTSWQSWADWRRVGRCHFVFSWESWADCPRTLLLRFRLTELSRLSRDIVTSFSADKAEQTLQGHCYFVFSWESWADCRRADVVTSFSAEKVEHTVDVGHSYFVFRRESSADCRRADVVTSFSAEKAQQTVDVRMLLLPFPPRKLSRLSTCGCCYFLFRRESSADCRRADVVTSFSACSGRWGLVAVSWQRAGCRARADTSASPIGRLERASWVWSALRLVRLWRIAAPFCARDQTARAWCIVQPSSPGRTSPPASSNEPKVVVVVYNGYCYYCCCYYYCCCC